MNDMKEEMYYWGQIENKNCQMGKSPTDTAGWEE
jgi:hypothetical protein